MLSLPFWGQKAPAFRQGDEGPSPVARCARVGEKGAIAPCQLNRVWAFRGKPFPRVKARTCLGHGARSQSQSSACHLSGVERNHPTGCGATQHRCKTVEAPGFSHGESSRAFAIRPPDVLPHLTPSCLTLAHDPPPLVVTRIATTAATTRRHGMNAVPVHGRASATTNAASMYESSSATRNGALVPAG